MNQKKITHSEDYKYEDSSHKKAHKYILPKVEDIINRIGDGEELRVFDLGCGNGAVAAHMHEIGHKVKGVDPSRDGIQNANNNFPHLDLNVGSAYDSLSESYGQFEVVLTLEVIEHIYYPRDFATTLFNLVEPGGAAIVSTPFHGYLKSLAIALLGEWGHNHYSPLWRNGHIKIWTFKTLRKLLEEAGFIDVEFHRAGRIRPLAKSMIAVALK